MKTFIASTLLISQTVLASPITFQCINLSPEAIEMVRAAGAGQGKDDRPAKKSAYVSGKPFLKVTFDDLRMNAQVQLFNDAVQKANMGSAKTAFLGTLHAGKVTQRFWSAADVANPAARMNWVTDFTSKTYGRYFKMSFRNPQVPAYAEIIMNTLDVTVWPGYQNVGFSQMACKVVKNARLDEWSNE